MPLTQTDYGAMWDNHELRPKYVSDNCSCDSCTVEDVCPTNAFKNKRLDLSKCFDTLNHELIIKSVNKRISDGKVLKLIEAFLQSGILEDGSFYETTIGSPQGGVISPLLMNIYMDKFDQEMKNKNIRIVRYADDILIFAKSKSEAGRYKEIATKILEQELKLTVNVKKTHITNIDKGIAYLGFIIKRKYISIHVE